MKYVSDAPSIWNGERQGLVTTWVGDMAVQRVEVATALRNQNGMIDACRGQGLHLRPIACGLRSW